jgi:hypothetical protein
MAELAQVLLFSLGASLAIAATLAVMPDFESKQDNYQHRVFYLLSRHCLPLLVFAQVVLRVFLGRFYP